MLKRSNLQFRVGFLGVIALILGLTSFAPAKPPEKTPGQPFEEILAAIGILNDNVHDRWADDDQ